MASRCDAGLMVQGRAGHLRGGQIPPFFGAETGPETGGEGSSYEWAQGLDFNEAASR